MRNTVDILGVPVDKVTMSGALEKVESFLESEGLHTVYTPNAEIMMASQRDAQLKAILGQADLLVADGAGVVLASKILGRNLPERVAGFDLTRKVLALSGKIPIKLFLFGGKPGVAELAGENILKEFPSVEIMGCRDGYFKQEDENAIIDQINSSGAHILLAALGAPKQEHWIHRNKEKLKVKICIGVGGSLDVFAGNVKRAPEFFQKNGLEWFYRLCKEPWRYRRMLDLPRFTLLALKARIQGGT